VKAGWQPRYGVQLEAVVKRLKKKNSVYSDIPLHPKLRELLKDYKAVLEPGPWLFPSTRNCLRTLSRVQAHNVLSAAFARLKQEGAKTHSMRRTFLTCLSRAGVPLRTIQEMSGHSSLGQLQEYLDVDPEDKHKSIGLLRY
jgi:integrase/recombinase XerD